jgi:hypothetical protein
MSAKVIAEASVTLQHLGKPLSAEQIAANPDMSRAVRAGIEALARAI